MDGSARLWDSETGAPLSPPLTHAGSLSKAIFSPGGLAVVTAGHDGAVKRWQVPPSELALGELALLAEVLAGGHLNQAGVVEPSTPAQWAAAWRTLRGARPELFAVSADGIVAWHVRQAQESERAKQWSAASFHLRRSLALQPNDAGIQQRLRAAEAAEAN
jgi:WD40 repeat protein